MKLLANDEVIRDLVANVCPRNSVGIEIGTRKGKSAESILKCKNVKLVLLIDPYKENPEEAHIPKLMQQFHDKCLQGAKKKLRKYRGRYRFIRKTSEDAAGVVDGLLDFVYVDGNHRYKFVNTDLHSWFPKIKSGGLFFGHDWLTDVSHRDFKENEGVQRAVRKFVHLNKDNIRKGGSKNFKYKYNDLGSILHISPALIHLLHIWWFIKK